ncbi:MAG: hypothetical protein JWQ09_4631, partial [Segetibacter sp.]|nr:hypothetical protein [Segetibacter sp.]
KALDTSTSFISQLFSGNKLANLITLAKLQKSYNISFEIKAHANLSFNSIALPAFNTTNYDYPKATMDYENVLTVVPSNVTPHYLKIA